MYLCIISYDQTPLRETMDKFILVINSRDTSTRAMVFNQRGLPIAKHQIELKQYFPQPGWVEHDPLEIWASTLECCQKVTSKANISFKEIAALGLTNQRETTVLWDKATGYPIYPAIVWQDRRSAPLCASLSSDEKIIQAKTGLLLDPYFSATKIAWLLNNIPKARLKASQNKLAFGTIDSFLLWQLTGGKVHATDVTNASRTLLFNIEKQCWDRDLLELFNIPSNLLPEVFDNTANFGFTEHKLFNCALPIAAMIGDQQAALVGQTCFHAGMAKSTYGTGAFIMINTGEQIARSNNRLLTTVAYRLKGKPTFAIEGSIFSAGTIVQWLRDKLHLINDAAETESLAASLSSNEGVYLVPAFTGLGAPYWDPNARAAIQGLTRDSQASHIVRAGLEAIGYQTVDLLKAMAADGTLPLQSLRVDGGMIANHWLMQFLADIIKLPVECSTINETTALGAAYLVGLQVGIFNSLEEISALRQSGERFLPAMNEEVRKGLYLGWCDAVKRVVS